MEQTFAACDFSVGSDYLVGLRPRFPDGIMALVPMKRYEPNGVLLVVGAEATTPANRFHVTHSDGSPHTFPSGIQASDLMSRYERVASADPTHQRTEVRPRGPCLRGVRVLEQTLATIVVLRS